MNGVKLEAKELRMYDYEKVVGSVGTQFPSRFSIQEKVTVKDQGDVGACLACTLASVAEYIWGKEMSEGFGYGMYRDKKDNGYGLSLRKALNYAVKLGFVPQSDFGILQEMPQMRELIERFPKLLEIAQNYKISGYAEITSLRTKRDNEIKDALTKTNIGLVAVSYEWFGNPHAIMLTGWDDDNDSYEYQNSYGEDFGVEGRDFIPKKEVDDVCAILFEPIKLPFVDVPDDAWYAEDVLKQYMAGYVNGTSETTFEPDRPITRAEYASASNRKCKAIDGNFGMVYDLLNVLFEKSTIFEEFMNEVKRR